MKAKKLEISFVVSREEYELYKKRQETIRYLVAGKFVDRLLEEGIIKIKEEKDEDSVIISSTLEINE